MPKAKPDRVEVIRIELQESERQILRDFVTSRSIDWNTERSGGFVRNGKRFLRR